MNDLAYDWVTKDGVCYVKDNGINIYKVTCEYGIYWAELLDKALGYKEDGATTSSWSEMYYKLNAAHWERHAHRLAKELADAKTVKDVEQVPPRYKAGDRVKCMLFDYDDWHDCTVKELIEGIQVRRRHDYRVVRDSDKVTYYVSQALMMPLPARTFQPRDKVRLKWDTESRTWEVFSVDNESFMARLKYEHKQYVSCPFDDLTLVEAAS